MNFSNKPNKFTNKSKKKSNRKNKKSNKSNRQKFFSEKFVEDCDLFGVSENITNNAKSMNQVFDNESGISKRVQKPSVKNINKKNPKSKQKNRPTYWAQFDAQRFDSIGDPSAPNELYQSCDKSKLADLERQLSYQGGWTQFNSDSSMSYGIVSDDKLTHNNMMPYFSAKSGYGSNDLLNTSVMNYKNSLFTGNLKDTWKHKQEIKPHFKPVADSSYIHGTPIYSDDVRQRYESQASKLRQNEKLFDSVQVTPGLNLRHDEKGTHGYHSMYRPLEKTVDELRVRPKITYEGRIIEGMRGQERAAQAPVITYKPGTYKTTTKDDLLPTSDIKKAPKVIDNFIMKDTARHDQHIEYTGGAYTGSNHVGRNVPEYMQEKYKESTRQNFLAPKPMQKHSKTDTKFNPNLKSYELPFTLKDQNIHNKHPGITSSTFGNTTYSNLTDSAKFTNKQITAEKPVTNTNIGTNNMRGTVHCMDIANPTIKEISVENRLNPNINGFNTIHRTYNPEIAKATIKETVIDNLEPSNVGQNIGSYANLTHNLNETIKETTVQIPQNNFIMPVGQYQRTPGLQDTTNPTIRETTVGINRNNNILPIGQYQRAPDMQDIARTTMNETVVTTPWNNHIIPVNQQQSAPHPQDLFRSTLKETTIDLNRNSNILPIGQYQRAPNLQDNFRTSTRETTIEIPRHSQIIPTGQYQRTPNLQDNTNQTIKETTIGISRNSQIVPINQYQRAPNLQDNLKTSLKEITNSISRNSQVLPIGQYQRAPNLQDLPNTNLKEITSSVTRNTQINPVGQYQRAPDLQDITNSTLREITGNIHRNYFVVPVNQQQRAPDLQDIMNPTLRETTVDIHRNNIITPVSQQQGPTNIQNNNNTTLKEISMGKHRNSIITPIGQQQRAPNNQDIAKSTLKETSIGIHRNTNIVPIGQQQRTPNPQDILNPTLRETIKIPYNTNMNAVGQQQGRTNLTDLARSTVKETMVSIPQNYITTAVGQQQGKTIQDSLRQTLKELNLENKHNPNIGMRESNLGTAHSFNRQPLRSTIKESIIDVPQNTHMTAVGQLKHKAPILDTARTTMKENIIQIPYNSVVTAVNQSQGSSSSFNREPLNTTTKEIVTDNKHIGQANHDGYGRGYGYLTEKKEAPNTNKQFTCQEVYIAPLEGHQKPKSYEAAYNAETNERKEALFKYRSPTDSGVNMGPDPDMINLKLRNDNHESRDPNTGYSFNNSLDRFNPQISSKISNSIDSCRYIDPMLVGQLDSNPFNIKYNI